MAVLTPVTTTSKPAQASLTVLAVAAAIALLYFGRVLLITLVISIIVAFLLEPLVQAAMKLKLPRGVASFLVCSIALLALYFAGLGLYVEIRSLTEDLPAYSERINELVDGAAGRLDEIEKSTYQAIVPKRFQPREPVAPDTGSNTVPGKMRKKKQDPPPPPQIQEVRVRPEPTPLVTYVYDSLRSFYSVLLMASFVPFLVYFMLSWRDHMRRSYLSMFDGSQRQIAHRTWAGVADIARAYVLGNFVLGLLISVVSAIFFASIKLPYWPLVGPLSGFLSLAPYIGLPLAILPPLIAALPAYRDPGMYLIIGTTTAVIHLLALNLLYPKIVGARVHLNPLIVTVALMFWGTLWGGIGLLLAIPLTAAVKAVCDNIEGLEPYGRILGD